MTRTSYTEARDKLASFWDETVSTREPVVMLPLDEWRGLEETAHLLRSTANAQRLLGALKRLESGRGKKMTSTDLAARIQK